MSSWRVIGAVSSRSPIRPTAVEIDLDALAANAAAVDAMAGEAGVLAVVKADAYGHGAIPVAQTLAASGRVAGLAVSLVEEGTQLRDAGIALPILVMGPALDGGYRELVGRDMLALVSDRADLEALAGIGRERGRPVPVHVKVDTGMTRLGIQPRELPAVVAAARASGGVEITGIATHLACADVDDPADPECATHAQLARFTDAIAAARTAGARPTVIHAANSSATFLFSSSRYDRVRCGIALYGNNRRLPSTLRQVMRFRTQIVQLRDVPAGAAVGYGASWTAPRASRLAVLPVGYADGLPRRVSDVADVLVRGRRCPLVGAVSMDIAVADVTALGDSVGVADEAILLGEQGTERITAAEYADCAGFTEYEVTCGMSKRVPRVYLAAARGARAGGATPR